MANPRTDKPLRVLQVIHTYHPVLGGSELLFQRLAEGLVARGAEVSVFTSTARFSGDFIASNAETLPAGSEIVGGVQVRRFPFRQLRPLSRRALSALSHLWSTRQWPGYGMLKVLWVGPHLAGFAESAGQLAPDIFVATASPFLPMFRAAEAARRQGRPFVVMPCLHPGDRWLVDNPALIRLLRNADGVMALTAYEIRLLRALGVRADRLWLIGGGVAADAARSARTGLRAEFQIPESECLVLFCGRKEEGKGVLAVLEAMVRLWQQGRPGRLVLAGASTDYSRTHLSRIIGRLPPEWRRRVIVRDNIDEDEKWGWFTECDVLAHPSHVESFGLVYLEAWLCGKPVIGGRTGPQCAVIDEGRDGFLVQPGSVDELVVALDRLLFEPGLGLRLGEAGREKVLGHFTWDSVVDRAELMFRTIAS